METAITLEREDVLTFCFFVHEARGLVRLQCKRACAYDIRKVPIRDFLISIHKTRGFEWQTAHPKGCQENRCDDCAFMCVFVCMSVSALHVLSILFTDILAGFAFNIRVLLLPAIVFQHGESVVLKNNCWTRRRTLLLNLLSGTKLIKSNLAGVHSF